MDHNYLRFALCYAQCYMCAHKLAHKSAETQSTGCTLTWSKHQPAAKLIVCYLSICCYGVAQHVQH